MSIVGKVFISVLNTRIKRWMESNKVIAEEQAGFREGHAAVDQVFVLWEVMQEEETVAFLGYQTGLQCSVERRIVGPTMDKCVRGKMWRI